MPSIKEIKYCLDKMYTDYSEKEIEQVHKNFNKEINKFMNMPSPLRSKVISVLIACDEYL